MNAASQKSNPQTSKDSHNAISSQALECGATPSGSQAGPTTSKRGQDRARASLSLFPENDVPHKMGVISGPSGSALLERAQRSRALSLCLANRLRVTMDSLGSTLFRLIWKDRITPSGRLIPALRASALHISAKDCTSVRSPVARDHHPSKLSGNPDRQKSIQLAHQAQLASVPTPQEHDRTVSGKGHKARGGHHAQLAEIALSSVPTPNTLDTINRQAMRPSRIQTNRKSGYLTEVLATVATPRANDAEKRGQVADDPRNGLVTQANLSTIPTPAARDYRHANLRSYRERGGGAKGEQLQNQVRQMASGRTPTGGMDATENIGQLNPEYSRWLMGLPKEFSSCADMVMPSSRHKQQPLSQRASQKSLARKRKPKTTQTFQEKTVPHADSLVTRQPESNHATYP